MVEWSPHPGPQTEMLRCPEREILVGGSRGGGKTEGGIAWIGEPEYITHRMYRSLVIRKDYDDLSDWILRARDFYHGHAVVTGGNPAVIKWKNGGMTFLGHWKDKSTLSKYIGREFQKILAEETTQGIKTVEEYKMLLGSLRSSYPELRAQFMGTTNPGGPGHLWVKKYWIDIQEIRLCEGCRGEGCPDCGGVGGLPTGRIVTSRNQTYVDPITGYDRIFIPSKATDNPSLDKGYIKWLNGLPPKLKAMWRDGSWDVPEGQFFETIGEPMYAWHIGAERATGRLFGGLDVGLTHPTSFGLFYLDLRGNIQRLFTYKSNSGTHRGHARSIADRIQAFRHTDGVFPVKVWAGPDAWTKSRVREDYTRSAIDEYEEVFREYGANTQFVRANNDRSAGCWKMKEYFAVTDGMPKFSYWREYNASFEEDVRELPTIDPNDPEEYLKCDGDDTADECRYAIMGIDGYCSNEQKHIERKKERQSSMIKNAKIDEPKTRYVNSLQDMDMG